MKKLTLALVAVLGMSSVALADIDYGLEVGIRQQSGDADSGVSTESQMGMQFGGYAHFPISGPMHLRTGMLYTQRPLNLKSNGVELKTKMNYLDIPVALMYKFEEYAGVYAGISLAMNLDKSVDNSGGYTFHFDNVKSPYTPFLLGAAFKFAENLGVNIYYESGGDVADGLKNYRAVGANLQITFD